MSAWLTAEDLECMQESVVSVMSGTAYLTRPTTVGTGGNRRETWGTVGTVACRVDASSGVMEVRAGERITSFVGFSIMLPAGTTLTSAYRITVDTTTYEVIGHDSGRTDQPYILATCRRLE